MSAPPADPRADESAGRRWLLASAVWGAAEATVFFVVPDVLTSYRALRRWRDGFAACIAALGGALTGGMFLYALARAHPAAARALVDAVPAVPAAWLAEARADLATRGAWALFEGALTGRPYKLFALAAAEQSMSLVFFVGVSAVARFTRFVAVTGLVWAIARALRGRVAETTLRGLHLAAWSVFYAVYFTRIAR